MYLNPISPLCCGGLECFFSRVRALGQMRSGLCRAACMPYRDDQRPFEVFQTSRCIWLPSRIDMFSIAIAFMASAADAKLAPPVPRSTSTHFVAPAWRRCAWSVRQVVVFARLPIHTFCSGGVLAILLRGFGFFA